MYKTTEVGLDGKCFTLNDNAFQRLNDYLEEFRTKLPDDQKEEVMPEIEARIADLFGERAKGTVIDIAAVETIIESLGWPDGSPVTRDKGNNNQNTNKKMSEPRKLFRNADDKKIAGVCSGLAAFFSIDVTILRIIFLAGILFGAVSFWIYVVIWIVAPIADSPAKKCQMMGLPVTAENMAKFS